MGMFDDIKTTAVRCPLCGNQLGWQSKDGGCSLAKLTPLDLMRDNNSARFYANCDGCSIWVEVSMSRRVPTPVSQMIQQRRDRLDIPVPDDTEGEP